MSSVRRQQKFEPLYDISPVTGTSIEVFYADRTPETFGRSGAGWFWWSRQRGFPPAGAVTGRSLRAMERTGMRWLTAFKMTVGINCSCPSNLVRLLTRCLPGHFRRIRLELSD
jgi:hypothetical protein